eukprot:258945-Hanusia_phi.AAC.1
MSRRSRGSWWQTETVRLGRAARPGPRHRTVPPDLPVTRPLRTVTRLRVVTVGPALGSRARRAGP